MDTRKLKIFVAIAEELHFGRAAKRCHISQPALSRQLRLLEEELGDLLFERDSRNVKLTNFGEKFLIETEHMILASERLRIRASQEVNVAELRFTIGMDYTLSGSFFSKINDHFTRFHPKSEINLKQDLSFKIIKCLIDGTVDIAIGCFSPDQTGFNATTIITIGSLRHALLVKLDSEITAQGEVTVGELSHIPLVVFPQVGLDDPDEIIRDIVQTPFFSPREIIPASTREEALQLITTLDAASLIIPDKCSDEVLKYQVLSLTPPPHPYILSALIRRDMSHAIGLSNLVDTVEEVFRLNFMADKESC